MTGIALFNGVILNLHFPSALYKKLLGRPTTLQDLAELDPDVAGSLKSMLDYDDDDFEEADVSLLSQLYLLSPPS